MSNALAWCAIACVVLAGSMLHRNTYVSGLPRILRLLFLSVLLLAVALLTGCSTIQREDWRWFLHDDEQCCCRLVSR